MTYDKCPQCGSGVWMVEYGYGDPNHYDGVSEYACKNAFGEKPTCDWRIGRFCGKKLGPKESETPYCTGEKHLVHA